MQVAVIGAGSWGTTVASLVSEKSSVKVWCRNPEIAADINENSLNSYYLPGLELSDSVQAFCNMNEAVRDADLLAMAVPSHAFRETLTSLKPFVSSGIPVISLAKGLEQKSRCRMTEVIKGVLPDNPAGVMTGPNLAKEILEGHATAAVVAFEDEKSATFAQELMAVPHFRIYTNQDVIGCELGGALKNVIALAAGMVDGLGYGDNTKAAVITRGLAELTRLGVVMGGDPKTFAGLAGMGDLIGTCISPLSRNRHVGEQLGRGGKLSDIIDDMNQVAEGVRTTEVVISLAEQHDVEMPISSAVHSVISKNISARDIYEELLQREMRSEYP